MAADWFLPLDEVGLRCLTEANGVNVSYPRSSAPRHGSTPRRRPDGIGVTSVAAR